jgi:hypothetical protein
MEKAHQYILDTYRMQLKHYFEKGFGEKSDFSNTIITPKLVKGVLDRYFELGGDLDFLNVDPDVYNEFVDEIQAC